MIKSELPYIGITDFVNREQVELVKDCIPRRLNRRIHVGAMTSYKVQHGIPTRIGWENIWLSEEGLHELFVDDKEVFNVIHYADYSEPNLTKVEDLVEALRKSGPCVNGIQLDMVWPSIGLVRESSTMFPEISIILQVGKVALGQLKTKKESLLDRVISYEPFVEYFLIDFSMGKGIPFNPTEALMYIEELIPYISQDRIVVAGGLGPTTYDLMLPVFKKYPNVSCDAQGQLKKFPEPTLSMEIEKACGYVRGICSLL